MIRLFRKIRQHLLSENRYSMYLLYASGEIVLVMIGILLALQIDRWNGNRKQDLVTREYLKNIKNDLVSDTLSINNLMDYGENWERRMGDYYEYYYQQQWSVNQIVDSCLSTGFSFITFIPINYTFNDMISSGNTSLLNDEIRMQLALLKKNQDLLVIISEHLTQDIKINVHELEKFWNMDKSMHFKEVIIKSRSVIDIDGAENTPESDQKLLQGLVFHHNIFNWTYKYIDLLRLHGNEIKSQSDDLIRLINKELN